MNAACKEAKWTGEELRQFCCYLRKEEKSKATIQKYARDVRCFLEWCQNMDRISKQKMIEYKAWLEERYAVRSANSMLTAVNQFLRYIGKENCCVKQFRLQQATFCDQRKELKKEEYFQLLDTARREGQMQTYYLIQTICATGIRVSELRYITVEALETGTAVAHNKGKSRVILIPQNLCQILMEYAWECEIYTGPVFLTKKGNVPDRSNIWDAMKRLGRETGLDLRKVYPHNLRHLFARTFYEQEKDISRLADILGHRSVNTTRGYIISSGEEHRAQIETLGLACGGVQAIKTTPHNVRLCGNLLAVRRVKKEWLRPKNVT